MIRFTTRALLIAGASLMATPAAAQDAGPITATGEAPAQTPESQADTPVGIGDIVVTARRREESLLDVPIAVTAFTGAQLEARGAIDLTDIAAVTPNTTIEVSRGTNSTLSAFIRGVGQQDPVPGFEAGVGLYLDDVYLNRPQAAVLDIYDVERVEVLRGPQGTLYGRNTIGGAIKYVTRRLPDEVEVKARGTYGAYNQLDGILSLSAPVGPFRVGASVAKLTRDGFGENTNLGIDNYDKDVLAARGTIEFTSPDGRLFMRLTGDFTDDESNARNGHRLIPGLLTGAPVLDDEYDTRAGLNSPRNDVEAGGVSLTVNAELSDAFTFRSISAFRKDRSFTPIDFDALPTVDVDVPAVYRNEQTSQEFQLLYESERLNGLIGFYYLDAKAATRFDVILATTGPLLPAPITLPVAAGFGQQTAGRVSTDTWSAFADFTFDFTDRLSLSGGVRYTSDDRTSTIFKANRIGGADPEFGGAGANFGAPITDFRGTAKFEKWTPRASLSFKPTDDLLLYGSYSKGFKGGGFDPRGSANVPAIDTNRDGVRSYQEIYDFFLFEPEEVDSYEVGVKGSAAGGALTFALTGFYADYKNVQIPGSVGIDANGDGVFEGFSGVTTNAASATFKGVELETQARFAQGFAGDGSRLTLGGTLGYIDAEYDEFIGVLGTDVADIADIQNTPTWTASGTLGALAPLGAGNLNLSTTVSYRSKTQQFEFPSPYLDQESYALWDANLVYTFGQADRFSIGVHAKNILDKRYKTSGYQFLVTSPTTGLPVFNAAGNPIPSLGREGIATVFYGNPRQVFGTLGVRF